MPQLSIAFVCNEYPPARHGGVGIFTQLVARALVRNGHRVRVVGSYFPADAQPEFLDDQGVNVFRLPRPRRDLASGRARKHLYEALRTWARDGDIDLIEIPDDGWAAGWPKLNVPLVTRVHGSATYFSAELKRPRPWSTYWIERASIRRADFWCAVSQYAADKTQSLFHLPPPGAISYVPVDLVPEIAGKQRSRYKVVHTGTLTSKKGVIPLIDAWALVRPLHPRAELHIFGKDTLCEGRSMKETLMSRLPASERSSVHFHGHAPREVILQELSTARLAVFPTYAEAFAFAPLEAMACGCPTIYSRRTSGSELMQDERDGILIDPDDTGQLASAIGLLLTNDQRAQQLAEAGQRRVHDNFTTDHLLPRIEEFYHGCVRSFSAVNGKRELQGVSHSYHLHDT